MEEQDLKQIANCNNNNFCLGYKFGFLTLADGPTQKSCSKD